MTRGEIVTLWSDAWSTSDPTVMGHIERFARLVAEREREECVKIAESLTVTIGGVEQHNGIGAWIADAIRARKEGA